jgi:nicotinamidase-related amidase
MGDSTEKTKPWQNKMEEFPQAVGDFDIDPKDIGLLIVDMQYYDAHPDYGIPKNLKASNLPCADYYILRLKTVTANCAKLIEFFRKNDLRIFYAAFGASMLDASDMNPLRKMKLNEVPAFTTEDFEYKILEEIKPQRGELVVSKTTRGSFIGTGLDHKMRMIGITTVVVVGAVTEICVASTARQAWDLGYKVILINDATAGFSEEDHNHTMRNFALYFGKVIDTDELKSLLSIKF